MIVLVKGVSRRVIVIKSPDPNLFEEAIFIVREDVISKGGVTSDEILKEAQRVADVYVKNNLHGSRKRARLPAPAFAAAGAGLTGVLWLVLKLVGI